MFTVSITCTCVNLSLIDLPTDFNMFHAFNALKKIYQLILFLLITYILLWIAFPFCMLQICLENSESFHIANIYKHMQCR